MTGAWHGGKGPNRRREDTAKVEANWPTNWSAREAERPLTNEEFLAVACKGIDPELLGRGHG